MRITEMGTYLQELRARKGVSQTVLAEALGVTNPYVSNIEQGILVPTDEMLGKIASFFKLKKAEKAKMKDAADMSRLIYKIQDFQGLPENARRAILDMVRCRNRLNDKNTEKVLEAVREATGSK